MLSPLIRARLVSVNGEPFQREMDDSNRQMLTREEERERRFRSRGLNVSYRPDLFNSEKIVAGTPLSNDYDFDSGLPAEISIEERYASRLDLEMGDLLVFDVQGIPVEGKIVNLRQVKWNSFQPNFFILFQTGVLEDAPASFLGSVSGLDAASRISVQTRIIKEFPNVSVIDVTRIVGRGDRNNRSDESCHQDDGLPFDPGGHGGGFFHCTLRGAKTLSGNQPAQGIGCRIFQHPEHDPA